MSLHRLGTLCGLVSALWLAAAEAPTKLVTISVSPLLISFFMVTGAFTGRWSLPALIRGTSDTFADLRRAPHLLVWGVMAGCLWAVGNALTVFAVKDIGLSLAFPLWNSNSLIGIAWGVLLFNELRGASALRKSGVIGGAFIMFGGAVLISAATAASGPNRDAVRGIAAALGAGLMFGSMYVPYRKAYISGMNPLTFLTLFTVGELGMAGALAVVFSGGFSGFAHQVSLNRHIVFWPFLGGLVWVGGDLLQNYATKYIGISRAIPLSNTNQLWGLLWAVFVFGELHGLEPKVIGGSILMALGALSISLSSASESELRNWRKAEQREEQRYAIAARAEAGGRSWKDYLLLAAATAVFIALASIARRPQLRINETAFLVLVCVTAISLAWAATALRKTTNFE